MWIKELTSECNNKEINILVDKVVQGTASNGSCYLLITFKDKTGTIDARLWDAKEYDIKKIIVGQYLRVNINIIEYRKILQAKINNYLVLSKTDINENDFVMIAPINPQEVMDQINLVINKLENEIYRKLMQEILKKYYHQFLVWPAAIRNHHEIKSGLIWHSYTMLQVAQQLKSVYSDRLIDFELLFCGVILHDLGKVIEIANEPTSQFTLSGKLIGHISLMVNELHLIASQLNLDDTKEVTYLKHLIIASHGKLEFGSPVEPHLLEAEILSFIDNLDARIYRIDKELEKISVNEQTPKILSVENRWFLKHFSNK